MLERVGEAERRIDVGRDVVPLGDEEALGSWDFGRQLALHNALEH